jgi:5-oxopent-3-ene-1,2,5-tricarboxylate decarboxylase/2-hydroxyhepta-2,4-diene-1,7-dioate isomerase
MTTVEQRAGAPGKIIAAHANYRSRIEQLGRPVPATPDYFLKPPSSVASDGDEIVHPDGCRYLCFEGEMALVIGRRARDLPPGDVAGHLAGVAAANDVGAHDFNQADRGSLLRVKGQDGFCPIGPVAPVGELDLSRLTLRTTLNGTTVQETSTAEMLFDAAYLVSDLSRFMTLEPGDVILTGTPAGSGVMNPGDEVAVELAGVSRVANRVVAGTSPRASLGAQPFDSAAARLMAGVE